MSKLLLFILLLVGIHYLRRMVTLDERPRAPVETSRDKPAEAMHACAHCGLMVPRSEGVESGDDFFCSAEHARLGRMAPHA